jgi:hypothetical protein
MDIALVINADDSECLGIELGKIDYVDRKSVVGSEHVLSPRRCGWLLGRQKNAAERE